MKLLSLLLIAILFIQVFVEATAASDVAHSLSQEDEGGIPASLRKIPNLPFKKKPGRVPFRKSPSFPNINCGYACVRRCSRSSRKNVCFRACKSCCDTCHCVPPGTYGNKNQCPCYASLKTHGNRPKCP